MHCVAGKTAPCFVTTYFSYKMYVWEGVWYKICLLLWAEVVKYNRFLMVKDELSFLNLNKVKGLLITLHRSFSIPASQACDSLLSDSEFWKLIDSLLDHLVVWLRRWAYGSTRCRSVVVWSNCWWRGCGPTVIMQSRSLSAGLVTGIGS